MGDGGTNVLQMHGGGISGESRPLLVERMKPLSSLSRFFQERYYTVTGSCSEKKVDTTENVDVE